MISLDDINKLLIEKYGIMIVEVAREIIREPLKDLTDSQVQMVLIAKNRGVTIELETFPETGNIAVTGTCGDTCISRTVSAKFIAECIGDPVASTISDILYRDFGK